MQVSFTVRRKDATPEPHCCIPEGCTPCVPPTPVYHPPLCTIHRYPQAAAREAALHQQVAAWRVKDTLGINPPRDHAPSVPLTSPINHPSSPITTHYHPSSPITTTHHHHPLPPIITPRQLRARQHCISRPRPGGPASTPGRRGRRTSRA